MDDSGWGLLPARIDEFPSAARFVGLESPSLPHRECLLPHPERPPVVARVGAVTGTRRVAGRCTVGHASCPGGVGSVDHGVEERSILRLLPARNLVFSLLARLGPILKKRLCPCASVFDSRSAQ